MLPDIHLDQTTFEELMESARSRIAGCYPEWTDFNYHDPGITLAELFAWMTEIQQYELDHIGDAHRRRYLKLLGEKVRPGRPSGTRVCTGADKPLFLPAGSRLEAPGVPFETEEEAFLPGIEIVSCFGFQEKKVSYLDGGKLKLGHLAEFYPFGRKAEEGTGFYLNLSGPLPAEVTMCLAVWTSDGSLTPRNPADVSSVPLARITWSFWNGRAWRPLTLIRDETFELLQDGGLFFRLPESMERRSVDGEDGWYLRAKLEESQYEFPPVLSFLDLNTLQVCQKETLAAWLPAVPAEDGSLQVCHALCRTGKTELFSLKKGCLQRQEGVTQEWDTKTGCLRLFLPDEEAAANSFRALVYSGDEWYRRHSFVGRGSGLPRQCFLLEDDCLLYEDVTLLVEEAERPGVYRLWEKKEDFSHSGPEDCHFLFDACEGKILFGDCEHGMAPEGGILLVSCSRFLGQAGNVKENKICRLMGENGEMAVANFKEATGGSDGETIEEAFARVRERQGGRGALVMAEDYEQAVRTTPGLRIESCHAVAGGRMPGEMQAGSVMQLVVRPCSLEKRPKLTESFAQNILRHLEGRRLLGVELRLLSPVYIRLRVYLEVTVHPQYQEAAKRIENAALKYLGPLVREFAGTVSYSGLYGYIDRLDCVAGIRSLILDARGNGVRQNSYGDLVFPENGIAEDIEIECSCTVRG